MKSFSEQTNNNLDIDSSFQSLQQTQQAQQTNQTQQTIQTNQTQQTQQTHYTQSCIYEPLGCSSKFYFENLSDQIDNHMNMHKAEHSLLIINGLITFKNDTNTKITSLSSTLDNSVKRLTVLETSKNNKKNKGNNIHTNNIYKYSVKNAELVKEIYLDSIHTSPGLEIKSKYTVNCVSGYNTHKFVFANVVLNNRDLEWKIKINKKSSWLAIGVCNKDQILKNKYKMDTSNLNHGTFLYTLNGHILNCNNEKENMKKMMFRLNDSCNDGITVKYSYLEKTLEFKSNNESVLLTNVFANSNPNLNSNGYDNSYSNNNTCSLNGIDSDDENMLVPCVVFMYEGDSVTFKFE